MRDRSGSALLIVLGMLSFMVVSAVGFSAYMRYSRLPSSFLRRSSSSRQLAKAALAKAVDIIDRSIGNAPHPGIGSSGDGNYPNSWAGRVYIGDSTGGMVEEKDTVPVLTFEGLAYIPPPLVNEARHYSRRSAAALWQQFDDFEAGRYAFCAIDVSDYLDINRLFADKSRNSSAERRVTLGYAFENEDHTSAGSGASTWDTFMEDYRDVDDETSEISYKSKLPLVSLADFNLALGMQSIGPFTSPFCKYIRSGKPNGGFYDAQGPKDYDTLSRMTFVTDGYFPERSDREELSSTESFDLSDSNDQPFPVETGGPHGGSSVTMEEFFNPPRRLAQYLRQRISSLGLAALHDYLDTDSVPASLVIPTTERVPMICGIQNQIGDGSNLKINTEWVEAGDPKSATYKGLPKAAEGDYCVVSEDAAAGTRTVCRTIRCTIEGLQAAMTKGVRVATIYPFAHPDDSNEISFSVDGRVALFFTMGDAPMTTRAGNANGEKTVRWSLSKSDFAGKKGVENGIVSAALTAQSVTPPTTIDRQVDAVQSVPLPCRDAMQLDLSEENPFLIFTRVWTQTYSTQTETWSDDGGVDMNTAPIREIRSGLPPLQPDGSVYDDFAECRDNAAAYTGKSVKLNVAVWLRVIEEGGNEVYDMVPASSLDDEEFNGVTGGGPRGSIIAENTFPLMRFETSVAFPLDPETLAAGGEALQQTMSLTQPTVIVADPRYNYAPESWFQSNVDLSSGEGWLQAIQPVLQDGDGDIFMAVSDQGYMQSVYELGFIPHFSNLDDAGAEGSSLRGSCAKAPEEGYPNFAASPDAALNYGLMWRTFDPLEPEEARMMRLLNISSGTKGLRINPYTDSTNVLMAAFANTPVDWRCASTNNVEEFEKMSISTFNGRYAWNDYSSVANQQLAYEDLERVAGSFMSKMRSSADWETAWDNNLDWDGEYGSENNKQLFDVTLDNSNAKFWGVDRKFLYGFWRECFDVRQQLFLVFVRAEPLMIGGEGIDQASPQLSSRAVALVWRDPAPSSGQGVVNGYPHQTRVLFYRPLE